MAIQDTSKLLQMGSAIQDAGDVAIGGPNGGVGTAKAVQVNGATIGGQVLEVGSDGVPRWSYGPSARVSLVGTNASRYFSSNYTTFTAATSRIPVVAGVTFKNLVLTFESITTGAIGESELPYPNDFEIRTSLELDGVIYPIFFPSGRQVQLMKPNLIIDTLPLGVEIPQGTTFFIRTWCNRIISNIYTSSSGEAGQITSNQTNWPTNNTARGGFASVADGAGVSFTTSTGVDPFLTDFTQSGVIAPSANEAFGPTLICGTPSAGSPKAVALFGDSITQGTGDAYTNSTAGYGFAVRAMKTLGRAYSFNALGGEKGVTLTATRYTMARMKNASRASTAIVAIGTNDIISSPATAAELIPIILNIQARLLTRVDRVIFCTIIPRALSTDNFLTVRNQTPQTLSDFNNQRIIYNAWLRTSGLPYFETADAVETARDSGIWKAPEVVALSGTSTAVAASTVTDSSKTWTTNQWLGYSVIIAGQSRVITSNTATALSLEVALSPVPGAVTAYSIAELYTADGTHPTSPGHSAMAQVLVNGAALIV